MRLECSDTFFTNLELSSLARHVFRFQGRRLGTSSEPYKDSKPQARREDDSAAIAPSEPLFESHLTEEELEQKRAERAAAAEARLKKQGGLPAKKKAKDKELVGPNSKPLMTWTVG